MSEMIEEKPKKDALNLSSTSHDTPEFGKEKSTDNDFSSEPSMFCLSGSEGESSDDSVYFKAKMTSALVEQSKLQFRVRELEKENKKMREEMMKAFEYAKNVEKSFIAQMHQAQANRTQEQMERNQCRVQTVVSGRSVVCSRDNAGAIQMSEERMLLAQQQTITGTSTPKKARMRIELSVGRGGMRGRVENQIETQRNISEFMNQRYAELGRQNF